MLSLNSLKSKTKKVLRSFLDLKDLTILILDEAKFHIQILDEAKLD